MNLESSVVSAPITTLIPHREPMVMVDRVVSINGLQTKTSLLIVSDNLFVSNGRLSEMGMLENIAQTSFIFLNHFFAEQHTKVLTKNTDTLGFISTISSAEVFFSPVVGQVLETATETELVFSSDSLKICNIEGVAFVNNKLAMKTAMKMLLQVREK